MYQGSSQFGRRERAGGVLLTAVCVARKPPDYLSIDWETKQICFWKNASGLATELSTEELADCLIAVFSGDGACRLGAVTQVEVDGIAISCNLANQLLSTDDYLGRVVYGHSSNLELFSCGLDDYLNPFLAHMRDDLASDEARLIEKLERRLAHIGCQVFLEFDRARVKLVSGRPVVTVRLVGHLSEIGVISTVSNVRSCLTAKYPHETEALRSFLRQIDWHSANCEPLAKVRLAAGTIAVLRWLYHCGISPCPADLQRAKDEATSVTQRPVTAFARRGKLFGKACRYTSRMLYKRAARYDSHSGRVSCLAVSLYYAHQAGDLSTFRKCRIALLSAIKSSELSENLARIAKLTLSLPHDRLVDGYLVEARLSEKLSERNAWLRRAQSIIDVAEKYRDEYCSCNIDRYIAEVASLRQNLDIAIPIFEAAICQFSKVGDSHSVIRATQRLACCYEQLGEASSVPTDRERSLLSAIAYRSRLVEDFRIALDVIDVAKEYLNIGRAYDALGSYLEAAKAYDLARGYAVACESIYLIVLAGHNTGSCLLKQAQSSGNSGEIEWCLAMSEASLRQALGSAAKSVDRRDRRLMKTIGMSQMLLGCVLMNVGKYAQAAEMLTKAYETVCGRDLDLEMVEEMYVIASAAGTCFANLANESSDAIGRTRCWELECNWRERAISLCRRFKGEKNGEMSAIEFSQLGRVYCQLERLLDAANMFGSEYIYNAGAGRPALAAVAAFKSGNCLVEYANGKCSEDAAKYFAIGRLMIEESIRLAEMSAGGEAAGLDSLRQIAADKIAQLRRAK